MFRRRLVPNVGRGRLRAYAQLQRSTLYFSGTGVPQDDTEGVRYLRYAADAGEVEAREMLAECYDTGRGVPRNTREAAAWRSSAREGERT